MTYQNYDCLNSSYDFTKIFVGNNTDNGWITWKKPPNANVIYIKAIGAGGGGGGGVAASGSASFVGGSGGGGGTVINTLIPAFLLPDTIYIKLGVGGSGGLGGTYGGVSAQNGGSGTPTYVSIFPNTEPGNAICVAFAGLGGTSGLSTLGSGGATNAVPSSSPFCYMGLVFSQPGRGSSPVSVAGNNTTMYYPGTPADCGPGSAGGGNSFGTPFSGAPVVHRNSNQPGIETRLKNILGGVTATGNGVSAGNGENGFNINFNSTLDFGINNCFSFNAPLVSSGGGGGGAADSGASAGNGGNGGFGSGGGGGGSTGNSTYSPRYGGNGGNGGPGLVIIQCI